MLAELEPEQVSVVDLEGRLVAGELEPTSEVELHLGVMRVHGVGALVHTHAPMSTAAACVLDELPCVHYAMLDLGGPVPVAPYVTFGTPRTLDARQREEVARAIEARGYGRTHAPARPLGEAP